MPIIVNIVFNYIHNVMYVVKHNVITDFHNHI